MCLGSLSTLVFDRGEGVRGVEGVRVFEGVRMVEGVSEGGGSKTYAC